MGLDGCCSHHLAHVQIIYSTTPEDDGRSIEQRRCVRDWSRWVFIEDPFFLEARKPRVLPPVMELLLFLSRLSGDHLPNDNSLRVRGASLDRLGAVDELTHWLGASMSHVKTHVRHRSTG